MSSTGSFIPFGIHQLLNILLQIYLNNLDWLKALTMTHFISCKLERRLSFKGKWIGLEFGSKCFFLWRQNPHASLLLFRLAWIGLKKMFTISDMQSLHCMEVGLNVKYITYTFILFWHYGQVANLCDVVVFIIFLWIMI